jgi:AraC-like DNA-binding protein
LARNVELKVTPVLPNERVDVRADAPTMLVGIERSTVRAGTVTLDRTGFVLLPRGAHVVLEAEASGARVAIVALGDTAIASAAREYERLGFDKKRLARWLGKIELMPRTTWIHEIVHRYVFERWVLGEHDNAATRFLECEIVKEIYFLFRDRDGGADRASVVRAYSPAVERAVSFVEAHLFDPCSVATIAEHVGASESALLRAFRRELGVTPAAYWRNRKLDEALVLVRAGRHSMAEIATRVGYENAPGFAHAFRLRFGRSPSSFRPHRPLRSAP